jgi:hypothetical protein
MSEPLRVLIKSRPLEARPGAYLDKNSPTTAKKAITVSLFQRPTVPKAVHLGASNLSPKEHRLYDPIDIAEDMDCRLQTSSSFQQIRAASFVFDGFAVRPQ